MTKPVIFMFSGQGSHVFHMGRELYETNEIFNYWMKTLNSEYKQLSGISIIDFIYNPSKKTGDLFNDLAFSHPALFMVEYSLAKMMQSLEIEADMFLGSSLGEFTACSLSEAFSYQEALTHIMKQVAVFENNCPKGGMVTILEDVSLYKSNSWLHNNCEIASINFDRHFVVSTDNNSLSLISEKLESEGVSYFKLPVEYGFHSSHIDSCRDRLSEYFSKQSYNSLNKPVISSLKTETIKKIDDDFFWNLFREKISFRETIEKLEKKQASIYIDLGPSGTLATILKYILHKDSESLYYSLLTPYGDDRENLNLIMQALIK